MQTTLARVRRQSRIGTHDASGGSEWTPRVAWAVVWEDLKALNRRDERGCEPLQVPSRGWSTGNCRLAMSAIWHVAVHKSREDGSGCAKKSAGATKSVAAAEAGGLGELAPSLRKISVVAKPGGAELHAGVGTATLATPLAAGTALAEAIVAMPAARSALARAMVAVHLRDAVVYPVGYLPTLDGAAPATERPPPASPRQPTF